MYKTPIRKLRMGRYVIALLPVALVQLVRILSHEFRADTCQYCGMIILRS